MNYLLLYCLLLTILLRNVAISSRTPSKLTRNRRVIEKQNQDAALKIVSQSKDDDAKDKQAAEAINRLVLSILDRVAKVGNMKKNLGLDKKFNIGSMSFMPYDAKMREELIKDVNNMNTCINRLFENAFLKSSTCGRLPDEFSKFLNWLIKDGASKNDVCLGKKKPVKLIRKNSKICFQ